MLPLKDIWQYLETFWVSQLGCQLGITNIEWVEVSDAAKKSYSVQDSPQQQRITQPEISIAPK